MKIVTLNAEQFDKYAQKHRYRNYYQSSAYANTMIKFGYSVHYLGIANNLDKLIGATLIIYKEVFMNNKIAYAPRGILFNYEDEEMVKELATKLKQVLGKQGFMLLRIDPYIPLTVREQNGNIINFNNQGEQIINNLTNANFTYKGKNLFFETEKPRWEALVLLNKDIREIFSKFDKRTRNKIRRAANCGIEVYKDESKNINDLYKFIRKKSSNPLSFYQEMCNNYSDSIEIYYAKINTEAFIINSRRTYEAEIEHNGDLATIIQNPNLDEREKNNYLNKKMESDKLLTSYKNNLLLATELLKKYPEGLVIAGAMSIIYDNAAFIFADGIDETYTSLNANYLLKWRMIDDYNKQNRKYLNLNAIVGEFEKKNKYSGLNEMKLGFNTMVTEYLGEFEIILNNFTYNLYKGLKKNK